MWDVRLSRSFVKELAWLEQAGQSGAVARLRRGLEALEQDPVRPRPGADIRPLEGASKGMYRLRVGPYQILYETEPSERIVWVTVLAARRSAYR